MESLERASREGHVRGCVGVVPCSRPRAHFYKEVGLALHEQSVMCCLQTPLNKQVRSKCSHRCGATWELRACLERGTGSKPHGGSEAHPSKGVSPQVTASAKS
jgi:hypothetical protein